VSLESVLLESSLQQPVREQDLKQMQLGYQLKPLECLLHLDCLFRGLIKVLYVVSHNTVATFESSLVKLPILGCTYAAWSRTQVVRPIPLLEV
jgi:hypothetical protein